MWLLDCDSVRLVHITDDIPPYAILSHTWTTHELTFEDVHSSAKTRKDALHEELLPGLVEHQQIVSQTYFSPKTSREKSEIASMTRLSKLSAAWEAELEEIRDDYRANATKVVAACRKALQDGFQYIWIDTCCIDKRSSSQLSESINSMFEWYANSGICYAYLEDVDKIEDISNSRWFTRAWTLQELLAPKSVEFYSNDWKRLGSKVELGHIISQRTGISERILRDPTQMWNQSIASRMSWAADRRATRREDIAYSLLGIFGVNMPLLYGEGEKAFSRLQQEIIRISDDQTILYWDSASPVETALASSPTCFKGMGYMVPIPYAPDDVPYVVTQRGLQIQLPMIATNAISGVHRIYKAVIGCHLKGDFSRQAVIFLKQADGGITSKYIRCKYQGHYSGFIPINETGPTTKREMQSIYIPVEAQAIKPKVSELYCRVSVQSDIDIHFDLHHTEPRGVVVKQFNNPNTNSMSTYVIRRSSSAHNHDLAVGFVLVDKRGKHGYIIALYFPHRSVDATTLRSVKIFDKPQDWAFGDWLRTSLDNLLAAHISEMAEANKSMQATLEIDLPDLKLGKLKATLGLRTVLNQQVYVLNIETEDNTEVSNPVFKRADSYKQTVSSKKGFEHRRGKEHEWQNFEQNSTVDMG